MTFLSAVSSALILVALSLSVHGSTSLSPVILVPGFGGNQLDVKLVNANTFPWCYSNKDWYNIWLSTTEIAMGLDCMIHHMRLGRFADGTTFNSQGVTLRVPGFGDTDSVEYLNPNIIHSIIHSFDYFADFVKYLTRKGYKRGHSIRAAPYDFRKAPYEMSEYFESLDKLIEETYAINDNKPVVLVGHSMGGNVLLYFLQSKSQEWKDTYVKSLLSLGAPWAGSAKALKSVVSGDDLGHSHLFPPLNMRDLLRTFPATYFLLPHKSKWDSSEVLIQSPTRGYTLDDLESLFKDAWCEECSLFKNKTENLVKLSEGPGVKTYCLYGVSDDKTGESYSYTPGKRNIWQDAKPVVRYGPGDQTVNLRSLETCKEWPNTEAREIKDAEHFAMLSDKRVLNYVRDILMFDRLDEKY